ncbi:LppP/LprE family lipoprotein [Mycobacterium sp. Aquia_213]|uniref:LppP/LprE family lipoprotein n=1 Tax=Mycobacterium sp. Aquia_213 TaxID=2991728 RepID=UPI00226E685C|nr:LppP/LprE family lipoprotein [Mycobacterium sp. Aquia_213]WAC94287.1 LppP/LprE family lipoprotein [Mycobacterium sp. Aquia_213]
MIFLALLAASCGGKPTAPSASRADTCKESDGPSAETVRQAIASIPVEVSGSSWVEIGRGHTKNCRLYWVQIIPTIASETTPQQLVFFDHNRSLGTPTPNPKPYITVLPGGDDAVTVQYQWQTGHEEPCCPKGIGTVKFHIGPDGTLQALGKIPHQ